MADDRCSVDGCASPVAVRSRRLCSLHYQRWKRTGGFTITRRPPAAERGCSVPSCPKSHEAQGYCPMHYRRFKLYGDPLKKAQRRYEMQCSADGCSASRVAGTWCGKHYQRVQKHGDDAAVRYHTTVPKSGCVVDACERIAMSATGYCEAHYARWRKYGEVDSARNLGRWKAGNGYVSVSGLTADPLAGGSYKMLEHRYVMAVLLGRPLLATENVHHKNGDRGDNRPENLELWSTSQPSGQRVADKVRWARELLQEYGDLFPA